MRVGTEDKKKTRLAIALFAIALLAAVYEFWPSSRPEVAPSPAATAEHTGVEHNGHATPVFSKLDPSLRLDLLKGSENVTYQGSGRDIFHAQPEPAAVADVGKAVQDPRTTTQAPVETAHQNPPIPLKFYGFVSENDTKRIFLAQGDDVFVAREGDIVKGRYKVVQVKPNSIEVEDVLSNYSQSIPLTIPNS